MKKETSLLSAICILGLGVGLLGACQEIPAVYLGVEVEEHTHSYTAEVTTPATCIEAGEMTYTCECGDYYTEAIPATGHSWGEWSADVVDGIDAGTHTRVCSVCQTPETDAHQWGSWSSVSEGESSHYEKVCDICSAIATASSVSDIIDDLGDDEKFSIEVDNATDLTTALVDGATVVIPAAEDGGEGDSTIELSSALEVSEGVSTTLVVGDGATLASGSSASASSDGSFISVTGEDASLTLVLGEGSSLTDNSENNFSGSTFISVGDGASLTLELGDDSLVSAGVSSTDTGYAAYSGLITIAEGGSVEINGSGNITQTDGTGALIVVDYGGSCTVNGGDFFVEGSSNYSVVNDGEMIINGGIFGTTNSGSSLIITGPDKGTVSGDYGDVIQHDGAYLEINGGAFLGGKHVVKNGLHSTLVITGGEFDGFIDDSETYQDLQASEDLIYDASGDCTISGGTFGVTGDTSSTGMYQYVIRAGATGSDDPDSSNEVIESVVITGGEFHAGTSGLFNISNAHSTITLSATMFVTLQEIISADETISVSEPTEDGSYVLSMANPS